MISLRERIPLPGCKLQNRLHDRPSQLAKALDALARWDALIDHKLDNRGDINASAWIFSNNICEGSYSTLDA
jgi:hypothetical protein